MNHVIYVDSENRNKTLFPMANSYVVYLTNPIRNVTRVELISAMLPDIATSQYVTLDITELRTPYNQSATDKASNCSVVNGAFAMVPIKVSSTVDFYSQNYNISAEYPSRIESIDKLTVNWYNPDGAALPDVDTNKFILRFHTEIVTADPERPESLPAPVQWDEGILDHQRVFFILVAILVIGIIAISLIRKKSQ